MTKYRPAHVEIFTDAGILAARAAWAAVAVRADGRGGIVEACGTMRRELLDANDAEAKAAANGLHKVRLAGLIEPGERVVIRCDNLVVVERWRQPPSKFRKPARPGIAEAFAIIRQLAADLQCKVEFRHVKGHGDLSSGDRLAIFNARADFLCCRELGTARVRSAEAGVSDRQFAERARTLNAGGKARAAVDAAARLIGD